MKRLILTSAVLACVGMAYMAQAQGTIQLQNRDTAAGVNFAIKASAVPNMADPNDASATAINGSDSLAYRCALYTAAPGGNGGGQYDLGTGFLVALNAGGNSYTLFRTGAAAGFVNSVAEGGASRVSQNVDYGSKPVLVQLRAWSGGYTTYEAAYAASILGGGSDATVRLGKSAVVSLVTPASSTDPTLTKLVGMGSFVVSPVPEPSTFALAGLGLFGLYFIRRRK